MTSDDKKTLSPAEPGPVPDPARPTLPPITRVNSRILYAAAIFGLIVIWVVTFTVTSRRPQAKPPAPPQTLDPAPNLDSLAHLAERLRVAEEMKKKLAAQERPAPFDPFRGTPETPDSLGIDEPIQGPPAARFSAAEPPTLPLVRYASEAPPRAPLPPPGPSRYEQALTAPPLVRPTMRSDPPQTAETTIPDPTGRLVDFLENHMPAKGGITAALQEPQNETAVGGSFDGVSNDKAPETRLVRPRSAVSPYVLYEGTILPAVLTSEITSDLPGLVTATLHSPVYDSPSGHHLLLPPGTRALGRYDSEVAHGDSRLFVAWHRLILPDGRFFEIPPSAAVDIRGASGLADRTNRHLGRAFTSTVLLSILGAGAQLSQPATYSDAYRPPSAGQVAAGAAGEQIAHLSTRLLERDLQVKPTLTIRPGTAFGIVLQTDLAFPAPYLRGTEVRP
jgi:type IV secretory pathway VirB10-like protein